jgi:subtilisin family serine protease
MKLGFPKLFVLLVLLFGTLVSTSVAHAESCLGTGTLITRTETGWGRTGESGWISVTSETRDTRSDKKKRVEIIVSTTNSVVLDTITTTSSFSSTQTVSWSSQTKPVALGWDQPLVITARIIYTDTTTCPTTTTPQASLNTRAPETPLPIITGAPQLSNTTPKVGDTIFYAAEANTSSNGRDELVVTRRIQACDETNQCVLLDEGTRLTEALAGTSLAAYQTATNNAGASSPSIGTPTNRVATTPKIGSYTTTIQPTIGKQIQLVVPPSSIFDGYATINNYQYKWQCSATRLGAYQTLSTSSSFTPSRSTICQNGWLRIIIQAENRVGQSAESQSIEYNVSGYASTTTSIDTLITPTLAPLFPTPPRRIIDTKTSRLVINTTTLEASITWNTYTPTNTPAVGTIAYKWQSCPAKTTTPNTQCTLLGITNEALIDATLAGRWIIATILLTTPSGITTLTSTPISVPNTPQFSTVQITQNDTYTTHTLDTLVSYPTSETNNTILIETSTCTQTQPETCNTISTKTSISDATQQAPDTIVKLRDSLDTKRFDGATLIRTTFTNTQPNQTPISRTIDTILDATPQLDTDHPAETTYDATTQQLVITSGVWDTRGLATTTIFDATIEQKTLIGGWSPLVSAPLDSGTPLVIKLDAATLPITIRTIINATTSNPQNAKQTWKASTATNTLTIKPALQPPIITPEPTPPLDSPPIAVPTNLPAIYSWGRDRINQRLGTLDQDTQIMGGRGRGVRVYIVDSGVYVDHEQFVGHTLPGTTSIYDGQTTNDCEGHGTHVAGISSGTTSGVAPQATIIPVRVLDCDGVGSWTSLTSGLEWIKQNNPIGTPAIINISIAGAYNKQINNEIESLISQGILVIVSAGNKNMNACNASPASTPNALTVASTTLVNSVDTRSSYSNYGACVDIYAPGNNITSSTPNTPAAPSWYQQMSGTSMSAPHITGIAASLLSENPTLTPNQLTSLILNNASSNKINKNTISTPNLLAYIGNQPDQQITTRLVTLRYADETITTPQSASNKQKTPLITIRTTKTRITITRNNTDKATYQLVINNKRHAFKKRVVTIIRTRKPLRIVTRYGIGNILTEKSVTIKRVGVGTKRVPAQHTQ